MADMAEGTLILCCECRRPILESVKILKVGEMITAAHFRRIPEGRPKDGDPMECPFCGDRFHDFTSLDLPIQDRIQYTRGGF